MRFFGILAAILLLFSTDALAASVCTTPDCTCMSNYLANLISRYSKRHYPKPLKMRHSMSPDKACELPTLMCGETGRGKERIFNCEALNVSPDYPYYWQCQYQQGAPATENTPVVKAGWRCDTLQP